MSDKVAQEVADKKKAPPHTKRRDVAYPDYNKSLIMQRHRSPLRSGGERAAQTGLTGAVLGALIARIMSNKPQHVAGGALAGGALGAVPGFISGTREADSENSRLLFLRRRMGINEPGEFDALLQHPEVSAQLIQKSGSTKQAAIPPAVLKAVIGGLAGGAAGAGWGYGIAPHISGYADVPAARQLSGVSGTLTGAAIGALARGRPAALKAFLSGKDDPRTALALPGAIAAGELIPSGVAMMARQSKATQELADATKAISLPETISRLASSSTARGAGVGVGAAGLAAIVSGLSRSKRDKEIREGRGRAGMVTSDFLKYLLPAMVGGGVVGSLVGKRQPA
jgi:hypothetical protein